MSTRANLGISINISAPIDEAERCCRDTGITRHSVEYSLGFCGRVDRLPDATVLELSTMCGHGMLSAHFAKKMIDWVKENRRTPAECRATWRASAPVAYSTSAGPNASSTRHGRKTGRP